MHVFISISFANSVLICLVRLAACTLSKMSLLCLSIYLQLMLMLLYDSINLVISVFCEFLVKQHAVTQILHTSKGTDINYCILIYE